MKRKFCVIHESLFDAELEWEGCKMSFYVKSYSACEFVPVAIVMLDDEKRVKTAQKLLDAYTT
jgi:hypothetical protein